MKIVLATQGSQGVVAVRELFALGFSPKDIRVAICKAGVNEPLVAFLNFNEMKVELIGGSAEFDNWLGGINDGVSTLLSISWKYKFSDWVIKRFGSRAINLHPGLLPEYKGCFSTPWSIIKNERYTGFTYHVITSTFDDGPILLREKVEIKDCDTSHSLNYRVMQKALSRLEEVLGMENSGCVQTAVGQYYPNKLPYGGEVDPTWDAQMRERFIRAMYFPPYDPAVEIKEGVAVMQLPNGIEND